VQEALSFDHFDCGVFDIGVVVEPDLAGLFDVDDPLRLEVACNDRGNACFASEDTFVIGVAGSCDLLERLKRLAIECDDGGRPVTSNDSILALIPLVLGRID
jgi:hypothetical protein